MSKITATYTPTLTNMRVVRTLENILPIRFQPLDEDIIRRVAQLAQVEGRTIHLWGDGEKHHESYFVTRGKVRFKINIDRHADRTDERYVSFTSHMGASERDGIKVITQVNTIKPIIDRTCFAFLYIVITAKFTMKDFLVLILKPIIFKAALIVFTTFEK